MTVTTDEVPETAWCGACDEPMPCADPDCWADDDEVQS